MDEPMARVPPAGEVAPAPLEGRRVSLRPVQPTDSQFLFWMATSQYTTQAGPLRGAIPPYESFVAQLWDRVFLQMIVSDLATGESIGHCIAYNAELRHGYAYVGTFLVPGEVGTGVGIEAGSLFVNYLFHYWPFQKLYAEALGPSLPQFQHGLGLRFVEEGRFRDHAFIGGQRWDLHVLALYRDAWAESSDKIMRFLRRRPEGRDGDLDTMDEP